jgi:RNA-directed DNA polymerase
LELSPEELRDKFFALETRDDVAALLEVKPGTLAYHLYKVSPSSKYTTFQIPKKSGGTRTIRAPATALKIIQRKLNTVLQAVYQPKPSVHGFALGRSILSNANAHTRKRYVFNVDLLDFFPCINFGRVRGLFMHPPYNLNPDVATVLAQICCSDNQLPQGAPTSPVVANMICSKMDAELQRLAKEHRCTYTRYADDLTFSTTMRSFPRALAVVDTSAPDRSTRPGGELVGIIRQNGFEINSGKVRLKARTDRQVVTGLTTNVLPNVPRSYVRRVRGMLHAWEKYGEDQAQSEYWSKYQHKHRNPARPPVSFREVVRGRLEFLRMIKGWNNPTYFGLASRAAQLAPGFFRENPPIGLDGQGTSDVTVVTEGKTDMRHLRRALVWLQGQGQFTTLRVTFNEEALINSSGSDELLQFCKQASRQLQSPPTICIFDRDVPKIRQQVCPNNDTYKAWGNNVYSLLIPVPKHRQETPEVCIELYYQDDEIKRTSAQGRRLYLSSEFHRDSGKHLVNEGLNCADRNKVRTGRLSIVDNDVFDLNHANVALSKNDFADLVSQSAEGFDDFSFDQFSAIFQVIESIITNSS